MDAQLVSALASALGGGVQAYQTTYDKQLDRNQKDMEIAARLRIESRDTDYKNFEKQYQQQKMELDARKQQLEDTNSGLLYDPDAKSYSPVLGPLPPKAQADINYKNAAAKNLNAKASEESGPVAGQPVSPFSKQGQDLQKDAKDLQDHLDKGWTARSGAAGKVQDKINAAEYGQGLLQQGRAQEAGLDSRQIEELAEATGRMLGGGAVASARIEALVPKTAFGKARSLEEWLSGKPTGLQMQAFSDRLGETIDREKAIAETQKRQYQVEGLARFSRLKTYGPDLFNSILQSKGITPDMIDQNSRYVAPKAGGAVPAAAPVNNAVGPQSNAPGASMAPTAAPGNSAVGPHGPTVQQNGHIYNWNPQSGKYE